MTITINRKFVCILLICAMMLGIAGSVSATVAKKTAAISYNNIKIVVNGKQITTKDASGKVVEPFIMDGTTYLPVRGVGEALGMQVAWDGPSATVALSGAAAAESTNLKAEIAVMGMFKDILNGANSLYIDANLLLVTMTMSDSPNMDVSSCLSSIKKMQTDQAKSKVDFLKSSVELVEKTYNTAHVKEAVAVAYSLTDQLYSLESKIKTATSSAISYLTTNTFSFYESYSKNCFDAINGTLTATSDVGLNFDKHRYENLP